MPGVLKRRFTKDNAYGRRFTEGMLVAFLFLFLFFQIASDVFYGVAFREVDLGLMNLISDWRTLEDAHFHLFFTYLGSWGSVASFGVIALSILWLLRKKRMAIFLLLGTLGGYILRVLLQESFARPRPFGYAWILIEGFSFPSGHAMMSTIFYGILGYFIYRSVRRRVEKAAVIFATLTLIFLIGISRIYLGVHWFSDVLAGWSIGAAIVVFVTTLYRDRERFFPLLPREALVSKKTATALGLSLFALIFFFVVFFYRSHPLYISSPPSSEKIYLNSYEDLISVIHSDSFPKFSETLTGKKMSPFSSIVIGSEEDLVKIFHRAGWFEAEKPVGTILRLTRAAILNRPYPTAPVTPAFLDANPHAISFQEPTEKNTARERHHTRYWLTNYEVAGVPVWVGTASFDDGIRYLVTHSIDPDIDAEREYIIEDLLETGLISKVEKIQLVSPLEGKNAGGDEFYTDGKTYVVALDREKSIVEP